MKNETFQNIALVLAFLLSTPFGFLGGAYATFRFLVWLLGSGC
jgi:hypothetical protein